LAQVVYGISAYVYVRRINRIYTYIPYKPYKFRIFEIWGLGYSLYHIGFGTDYGSNAFLSPDQFMGIWQVIPLTVCACVFVRVCLCVCVCLCISVYDGRCVVNTVFCTLSLSLSLSFSLSLSLSLSPSSPALEPWGVW